MPKPVAITATVNAPTDNPKRQRFRLSRFGAIERPGFLHWDPRLPARLGVGKLGKGRITMADLALHARGAQTQKQS
jgi:hypothetical protein